MYIQYKKISQGTSNIRNQPVPSVNQTKVLGNVRPSWSTILNTAALQHLLQGRPVNLSSQGTSKLLVTIYQTKVWLSWSRPLQLSGTFCSGARSRSTFPRDAIGTGTTAHFVHTYVLCILWYIFFSSFSYLQTHRPLCTYLTALHTLIQFYTYTYLYTHILTVHTLALFFCVLMRWMCKMCTWSWACVDCRAI